jgi:DNA-binding YbaB/EbfC family protein
MFGLAKLLKQAQELQENLEKVKEELGELQVEGTSGGGMVRVRANGRMEILKVDISPEALDPSNPKKLEDLVAAAVNQALGKARRAADERMAKLTTGILPPGMKWPGLA